MLLDDSPRRYAMTPTKDHAQFMRAGNSIVDRTLPAYQKRPISRIARDIVNLGANMNPAAYEYLRGMLEIQSIEEPYYYDTAYDVVLRFYCNASHIRVAGWKELKAELKGILDNCPKDKRI